MKDQGGYKLQRHIAIMAGLAKKQAKPKPKRGSNPNSGLRASIRNVFKIRQKTGTVQLLSETKWKRHIGTMGLSRFE